MGGLNWFANILWAMILIPDLVMLGFILRHNKKIEDSKGWSKTTGKITQAKVSYARDSNDNEMYTACFAFTYDASGTDLPGNFYLKNIFYSQAMPTKPWQLIPWDHKSQSSTTPKNRTIT